jgi:hypothetical protein
MRSYNLLLSTPVEGIALVQRLLPLNPCKRPQSPGLQVKGRNAKSLEDCIVMEWSLESCISNGHPSCSCVHHNQSTSNNTRPQTMPPPTQDLQSAKPLIDWVSLPSASFTQSIAVVTMPISPPSLPNLTKSVENLVDPLLVQLFSKAQQLDPADHSVPSTGICSSATSINYCVPMGSSACNPSFPLLLAGIQATNTHIIMLDVPLLSCKVPEVTGGVNIVQGTPTSILPGSANVASATTPQSVMALPQHSNPITKIPTNSGLPMTQHQATPGNSGTT